MGTGCGNQVWQDAGSFLMLSLELHEDMSRQPAKGWPNRVSCCWCVCRQGASKAGRCCVVGGWTQHEDSEMPQKATGSRGVLHSAFLSSRVHKSDVSLLELCRSRSTPAPYQPVTQGTLPQWQQLEAIKQL